MEWRKASFVQFRNASRVRSRRSVPAAFGGERLMPMSKSQGEALTALLHQLRRDWGLAGIAAAVRKASLNASATDVAVAACRCAANLEMRTPALIAGPGPHWQGTPAGTRLAPVMCVEHPAEPAGRCLTCHELARPKPDGFTVPKRDRHVHEWVPS